MRAGSEQQWPRYRDRKRDPQTRGDAAPTPGRELDHLDLGSRQAAALAFKEDIPAQQIGGIGGSARVAGRSVGRARHPEAATAEHGIAIIRSGKADEAQCARRSRLQHGHFCERLLQIP